MIKAEDVVPKAARGKDQLSTQFIHLIGKLYAAESRTQNRPQRRARIRRRYSSRVLRAIKALVDQTLDMTAPSGALGKALTYLVNQWPKLIRYVENGTWPIDNNACENAIRPFVIGRKAWLFSDTVGGAKASANLYSIVETCKANDVDAYRYLTDLFRALPQVNTVDDYDALLPWRLGRPMQKSAQ